MTFTNTAAWTVARGGPIEVRPAETPVPGEGEILVKTEVIAMHPLDAKLYNNDYFGLPVYPAIFGASVGGTVVQLGPNVDGFAVGDQIVSSNPTYFPGWSKDITRYGTFQRYTIAFAKGSAKLVPGGWSMREAITIPTQAKVAAMALGFYAGLKRPHTGTPARAETVLVWGGASAVGTYAVQYAAQAGYKVVTTASPGAHDRLRALGATAVYDYKDSAAILGQLKSHVPYVAVLDCIGLPSSLAVEAQLFDPAAGPERNVIHSMVPDVQGIAPPHVSVSFRAYGAASYEWKENEDFIAFLWDGWLKDGIQKKTISPQEADLTVGGLDKVAGCLAKVLKSKGPQIVLALQD